MIKAHDGREIRGFRFRLYTTSEQDLVLRDLQTRVKAAWNWLCYRACDVSDAREAYAARYHGIVRPARPEGDGPCPEYFAALKDWRAEVRRVCKSEPAVSYRSVKDWCKHFGCTPAQESTMFLRACGVVLSRAVARAVVKDYAAALQATARGQRPPRPKRGHDHATLRSRDGKNFRLVAHGGPRPGCPGGRDDFLNCEVHLPGVDGWIRGRLDTGLLAQLQPPEYWVEGVSVVEEPDGWYASVRQWVIPRTKRRGVSPESRWRGYGLPSRVQDDRGRSPDWIESDYRGWTIGVRDRGPQQDPDHRWRVSLKLPDGDRWDPNKSCPSQETATAWAKLRIDQYVSALKPGVKERSLHTTSPIHRGGGVLVTGIDAGLCDIATVAHGADVLRTGNTRALDLLEQLATRQQHELPVGRMHAQAARRTWHMLRGALAWIHECDPERVVVEDGVPWASIAQWIQREAYGKTRRSGGYVPCFGRLLAAIKADFGDRVVEVDRANTTVPLAEDGTPLVRLDNATREVVSKRTRKRTNCDVAAAREIARKGAESLDR